MGYNHAQEVRIWSFFKVSYGKNCNKNAKFEWSYLVLYVLGYLWGKKVPQSVFRWQLPNERAQVPANLLKWSKSLSILVANLSKICISRSDYNKKNLFLAFFDMEKVKYSLFLHLVTVLGAIEYQKPEIVASACSGCLNTEDF